MPAAEAERPFSVLPASDEKSSFSELNRPTERSGRGPRPTLLILKDGQAYVVTNYWIDANHVVYVASDGSPRLLALEELDFQSTVRFNRERGVPFVLRSKYTEP